MVSRLVDCEMLFDKSLYLFNSRVYKNKIHKSTFIIFTDKSNNGKINE